MTTKREAGLLAALFALDTIHRIEWYCNRDPVETKRLPAVLFETVNEGSGRPFGVIFANHRNRIHEADPERARVEEIVVDWVRAWEVDRTAERVGSVATLVSGENDAETLS